MFGFVLSHWSVELVLLGALAVTVVLHQSGYQRLQRGTTGRMAAEVRRPRFWRAVSFYLGLAAILVALASPVAYYAAGLFWVHMLQELLLVSVAAPCIALGAPWGPLALGLPAAARSRLRRAGPASGAGRALLALGRGISHPVVAFVLFNGCVVAWQVPAAYGLAVRVPAVGDLQHVLLLGLSINLWLLIVDSPPLRSRLNYVQRSVFIFFNAAAGWVVAVWLGYSTEPLYGAYTGPQRPQGSLPAVADQQLGAGVMWVPGMIAFTLAFVWCLWRWLEAEDDPDAALRKLIRDYGPGYGRVAGTRGGTGR